MNILMTLSNPFVLDARVYNEAQSLIKNGHKVTIIAWDRNNKYKKKEFKDGIKVVRVNNTRFMDLLPYDILKLFWWEQQGIKRALELHNKESFDIVHCHNLDSFLIGIKLKKRLDIPLIYDAHEIWGYMVEKDLPGIWAKHYLKKERSLIKKADRVITVNEPLKDYFSKFTDKKITLVMNCKHLITKKYEPSKNKVFTLLYIGGLLKSRFLIETVEAISDIKNVKFIIGGIGKKEYVEQLKKKCSNSKNCDFIGAVPRDKVIPMTKKSDMVICIFDPKDKNNQVGLPNKVFESAVCGRPILITKGLYYEKIVVNEGKFGVAVKYSKEDIKKAVKRLRDDKKLREELGRNALAAAIKKYNWEKQEKKLISVYEDV